MGEMVKALFGLTLTMTAILLFILWLYPIEAGKKRGPIWLLIISAFIALIAAINIDGALSKKEASLGIEYIEIGPAEE